MTQSEPIAATNPAPKTSVMRLHSASPLFMVWANLKTLVLPLVISLGTDTVDIQTGLLALALLASLISTLQYRFFKYWLEPAEVIVRKGILFRNVRHIPCERIQNVQLTQGLLHRLLGVAQLQLESASGHRPEAVFTVVSLQAAEAIRQHIHQCTTDEVKPEPEAVNTRPPLLALDAVDILRCGLLQWRGPAILGGALASIMQYNPATEEYLEQVFVALEGVIHIDSTYIGIVYFVGGALSGLVSLWLLSTLMAWLKYHQFRLQLNEQKLSVQSGLLTRIQAVLPTQRIQLLKVKESPMHRWLRRLSVVVENAGGSQQEAESTLRLLAPVLRTGNKQGFLETVQGDVAWRDVCWQPVEAIAWRRVAVRMVLLLVVVQLVVLSIWPALLSLLALLLIFPLYWYSKRYVACLGYYLDDSVVGVRKGVWFKSEIYVRLSKVQAVTLRQSPFDRRYKMARLSVDTAGAWLRASAMSIPFLDQQLAQKLEQRIANRVSMSQFVW